MILLKRCSGMRGFAFLLLLPLLAGCGKIDWDNLTSFGSSAGSSEATAAPPVRESVAQVSSFKAYVEWLGSVSC